MPVAVANVDVSTANWGNVIDRLNESITAIRTLAVTTNSNTATGNAVVNGSIQGINFFANTISGGTIALPGLLTISSDVEFTANIDFSGTRIWVGGNKVWHAGNDGPASGLDADTLDGQQLAVLARTDVNETFDANVTIAGFLQVATANIVTLYLNGNELPASPAPTNNPTLTGNVTVPTYANNVANTLVASTAYVQNNLFYYAPKADPTFTGVPAAPTAANTTSNTQIATTGFVQNLITNLIDGAAAGFDTLGDIAIAIATKLTASNNLSDLTNAATARSNLGLVIGTNVLAYSANVAYLSTEDQVLTGGARVTPKDLGTVTSGTLTPDPGDRPLQYATNNGAHILAPGSNKGSYILEYTNGVSAGAITTSSWTKVVGSFTTTSGHKFLCSCMVHQNYSLLSIQPLQ